MSRLGAWMFLAGSLTLLVALPGRCEPPRAVDSQGDPLPRGARARLGTIRFRHGGAVYLLRCLSDGKTLLSYGADSMLRFWEAGTGKELRSTKIAFDPNQARLPQMFGRNGINLQVGFDPGDGQGAHCLSGNGRLLVVPQGSSALKIRDLAAGKTLREIKADPGVIRFVTLSPDDRLVAAAVVEQDPNTNVQTGRIRLWEVATGTELPALVGPTPKQENQLRFLPHYLRFAPDGKSVTAVGQEFNNRNGIIRVWHLGKEKEPIRLLEHGGTTGAVVYSPDGKFLAEVSANPVTGGNACVRIWDAATGKEVQALGDARNNQGTLLFTPDGKHLIDFDQGAQTLRVWDLAAGKESATLPNLGGIVCFVLSPDGKTLALGGNDQTLRLYETASGKQLHELKGFQGNFGFQGQVGGIQGLGSPVAFSTDGKIVFATSGNVIRRWNVGSGAELLIGTGPENSLQALGFSRDGKTLVTVGEGGFRCWDPATGKARKLDLPVPANDDEGGNTASALSFSPDGKLLALGWNDGHISLHEAATGKELRKLAEGHDSVILSLVFAGDGKTLVSSCNAGRAFWWDVASGKQLRQLAGPARTEEPNPLQAQSADAGPGPLALGLMPDGGTVVGAGMDNGLFKLRFWELSTGKLRRQLVVDNLAGDLADRARLELGDDTAPPIAGGFLPGLAIAPDGKSLAVGSGPNIELRELRHGREVRQFAIYGTLQSLVFAPNGKYLAGASDDGSIRIWDAAHGTVLTELRGHRGSVAALAFALDSATLASAGSDTTVLFWDLQRCLDMDAPPSVLHDPEVAQLWKDLAADDAENAFKAMQRLAELPKQVLPLLGEQLKPVSAVDKERLTKLVADLEHVRFDQRKRAAAELEKLAELAEPALKARLADDPSLDLKQRLEKLLEQLAGPASVPEQVRALRGLETLERIGTPEARQLVEKMAQGAAESRVTRAAKTTLERMTRKE